MKKVLIITYYWPPAGGPGVQRVLKFAKFLQQFGWEPIIYTVENGEYPIEDESLLHEIPKGITVIKKEIWEPFTAYKKIVGIKSKDKINPGFLNTKKKKSFAEKLSIWVRGNIFIPDARKFWIKPSVKFLNKYLEENKVDAIFSSGPPHSLHLIASEIQHKFKLPWIADFRDPWTNIDYYKELNLSSWADKKHHELEKKVLKQANKVLVVGNTMKEEFEEMGADNIEVITNGFDPSDFPTNDTSIKHQEFRIVHLGMMNKARNHRFFWETLQELCNENEAFKKALNVQLVGKCDLSVEEIVNELSLQKQVTFVPYVNHNEVFGIEQQASLLYLSINNSPNAKGVITGKIFEYLGAKRPILCIGPKDGDAAHIVNGAKAGYVIDFDDKKALKETLIKTFKYFQNGNLEVAGEGIEQYSREGLTKTLTNLLTEITSTKKS
ncbi:MAG: glycosyltransferase family 4 protein [Cytophagales bacterium]|nr:glycosyltransferase family 4 protein [Cytophagales bacterium]